MNRPNHKRLLAAAYLLALALWLVHGAGALVQKAWYTSRGLAPSLTLSAEELEFVSMKPYLVDYDPEDQMWVSSDSDPQIHWNQMVWVDTVVLDVRQQRPTGRVELYYKQPGQHDFSTRQVIYPTKDDQGRYVFDLRGKWVDRLRMDPDSVGGVLTEFRGVQINPVRPWYRYFVPSAGQWLLLLVLPLAVSALLIELDQLLNVTQRGQKAAVHQKKQSQRKAHPHRKKK